MTVPRLTPIGRLLGITALAALALVTTARPARAGDADDTVFLDNGGRLRGLVVEEGPASVTIKLADGTIRSVSRARVKQIAYGSAAPPAYPAYPAAPAPAYAVPQPPPGYAPQPPPGYALPQPGYAPQPAGPGYAFPPAAPGYALQPQAPGAAGWRFTPESAPASPLAAPAPRVVRRSKGMMITGIVLMPVGAVTVLLGAAACAVGSQCPNPQIGYADAILMGVGSAMLVSGIVFTAVGASSRAVSEATSTPPRFQLGATVGPRSAALVGTF